MNAAVAKYLNALAAEVSIHRTLNKLDEEREECRRKKKKFTNNSWFQYHNELRRRHDKTVEAGERFVQEQEYWQLQGQDIP